MKYHKEEIFRRGALLFIWLVFCTITIVALCCFMQYGAEGSAFFIALLLLICFGYFTYLNGKCLSEALRGYKTVKESGLLQKLKHINPYPTDAEMMSAVRQEKKHKIYEDDIIFMTDSFLGADNIALLIDGILDADVVTYKRKGITTKVELVVLYYNGKKIKAVYNRPLKLSASAEMRAQAEHLEYVVSCIAQKGKLFRKYDCCQLIEE